MSKDQNDTPSYVYVNLNIVHLWNKTFVIYFITLIQISKIKTLPEIPKLSNPMIFKKKKISGNAIRRALNIMEQKVPSLKDYKMNMIMSLEKFEFKMYNLPTDQKAT